VAAFRTTQEAFEALRSLYDVGSVNPAGFGWYLGAAGSKAFAGATGAAPDTVPSWDWYQAASEEAVPPYKVEAAKSGRSACSVESKAKACAHGSDPLIEKVRVA